MSEQKLHPKIELGAWLQVGQCWCVISRIYDDDYSFGVLEVVFNKNKPTNRDVDWDGEKWFFPERGDFGGYADKYPRLNEFVAKLRRGRYT